MNQGIFCLRDIPTHPAPKFPMLNCWVESEALAFDLLEHLPGVEEVAGLVTLEETPSFTLFVSVVEPVC